MLGRRFYRVAVLAFVSAAAVLVLPGSVFAQVQLRLAAPTHVGTTPRIEAVTLDRTVSTITPLIGLGGVTPCAGGSTSMGRYSDNASPFDVLGASAITKDPDCGKFGGADKLRHAGIFFVTTLGLQLFLETTFDLSPAKAFIISATAGTLIGIGREYIDKQSDKDCFDGQDLLANTAGILAAGVVIIMF